VIRRRQSECAGFTLIEVLVVMLIIVTLAGISLAMYTNSVTRAKEAKLRTNLYLMRESIDQYYADKNKYPPALDALVEDKYLRAVPDDPFTNSVDTWQLEMSEPEAGNPQAEIGVFDVHSGSEAIAIDGSRYADW
jgi:general secretion pathway protein G